MMNSVLVVVFVMSVLIGCIMLEFVYIVMRLVSGLLYVKFGLLWLVIYVVSVLLIIVISEFIVMRLLILLSVCVFIMLKLN